MVMMAVMPVIPVMVMVTPVSVMTTHEINPFGVFRFLQ
jgi:hypothetical protein